MDKLMANRGGYTGCTTETEGRPCEGQHRVGEGGPKIDNAAQGAKPKQKLMQAAPGRRGEV